MSTLGTLTYGYDANGQRTSVGGSYARTGLPAALASATYDDANQIAAFGGTSFTYDDNGNLTSDGVRSYTWNARNELTSLTGPVNGSFTYDAFGRRRSKTIGGTTTQFLYDGLNPVQELSGGSPTANLLTGLGIDEYFTRTDAGGVRNLLTDALGSTIALADGSGTIQTEYSYEPFGGTTTSGGGTGNSFAFTAREADATGLYLLSGKVLRCASAAVHRRRPTRRPWRFEPARICRKRTDEPRRSDGRDPCNLDPSSRGLPRGCSRSVACPDLGTKADSDEAP